MAEKYISVQNGILKMDETQVYPSPVFGYGPYTSVEEAHAKHIEGFYNDERNIPVGLEFIVIEDGVCVKYRYKTGYTINDIREEARGNDLGVFADVTKREDSGTMLDMQLTNEKGERIAMFRVEAATALKAGLMTSGDKQKIASIDGIADRVAGLQGNVNTLIGKCNSLETQVGNVSGSITMAAQAAKSAQDAASASKINSALAASAAQNAEKHAEAAAASNEAVIEALMDMTDEEGTVIPTEVAAQVAKNSGDIALVSAQMIGVENNVVTEVDFASGTLLNYNINTSTQAWASGGTSRYFSVGDNKYIHVKANSRGTVIAFMRKEPTNSAIDATELENDYIVKTDSGKKYLTYGAGTESMKLSIPAGTLYVVVRASNSSGDQTPEIFEMYKIDKTRGIADDMEDVKNDVAMLENEVFGVRKEVAYTHDSLNKIAQVYIASGDATIIAQSSHDTYTVYYRKLKAGTPVRIERKSGNFTIKRGYALEEPAIGVFVNDVEVYADTESRYDYVMPVDGYFVMYANAIDANIGNWTLYVTENTSSIKNVEAMLGGKIAEPKQEGLPGQVLVTDGRGGRSWASVAGGGTGVAGSGNRSLEDYSAWRKATWASMAAVNKLHPISSGAETITLHDEHGGNTAVVRAPQTIEEANLMKQCLQMMNLEWTAKGAIAGKQWDYVSGTAYKSFPYSSNGCKTIGSGVSIETFYTAVYNKYSLMYTENCYDGHEWRDKKRPWSAWNEKQVSDEKYLENSNAYAYYGTVCCGLTSAVVGCPAKVPNLEHHLFSEYQGVLAKIWPDSVKLTDNPIDAFPYLEVGDIFNDRLHSQVVIGVVKGADGLTEKIAIAESTSASSTNGCHLYVYQPAGGSKIVLWTKEDFEAWVLEKSKEAMSENKQYRKFYRPVTFYQNVNRYAPATDYVAVTDFGESKTSKTESSVMTFAGNKVTFRTNDLVVINYNIYDSASFAYTHLHVAKRKTWNADDAWEALAVQAISAIDNASLPASQRNHAWRLSDVVTLEDGYIYRVWADSVSTNVADKPSAATGYTYFDVVDGRAEAVVVSVGGHPNERKVKYLGSGKIDYVQINAYRPKDRYLTATTKEEVHYFTRGCSVFPLPNEVANNEVTLLPQEQFALMGYAYPCSHVRVIVRGKYGQVECDCVSLGLGNDEGGGDDTDPDADGPVNPNPPQGDFPPVEEPVTLPAYWMDTTSSGSIVNSVNQIKLNRAKMFGHKSMEFIFVTDIHWGCNAHMAGKLARYIKQECGWMPTLFGGDAIEKSRTTAAEALNDMSEMMASFNYDLFSTVGNHDMNTMDGGTDKLSDEQIYEAMMKYNYTNPRLNATGDVNCGFFDVADAGIRVIQLRVETVTWNATNIPSYATMLKSSLASMPSGYKAIVMMHGRGSSSNLKPFDLAQANVNSALSSYANRILMIVAGHTHQTVEHVQMYENSKSGSNGWMIPMFTYAADRRDSSYYGTTRESLLCVYQLDVDDNVLYRVRIGSGADVNKYDLSQLTLSTTGVKDLL